MKKFLTFGVLSAVLLTGCTFASESNSSSKGIISVNTEAEEEINPTSVTISFAIETREKDADSTTNKNKTSSIKAIDALKGLVDESKGEFVKTTSYRLSPEYSYKDGDRKLIGYFASNTLQVKLKDTEKAGKVISTALANGANSVNGVQFLTENTSEDCNKLIQKAATDARQRADKVAQSMNTTVVGIKNISTGCSTSQNYHTSYRLNAKSMMSDNGAAAEDFLPVESGKSQLRAYVNADFYVK